MRRLMTLVAFAATILFAGSASATDPRCDPGAKPRAHTVKGPDGRLRVVVEDPIVVCGKRQRPQAFYVLQRSRNSYQPAPLERSFVSGIPAAVRRAPF
jgi:hypothetical protein